MKPAINTTTSGGPISPRKNLCSACGHVDGTVSVTFCIAAVSYVGVANDNTSLFIVASRGERIIGLLVHHRCVDTTPVNASTTTLRDKTE